MDDAALSLSTLGTLSRRASRALLVAGLAVSALLPANAHHSTAAVYDRTRVIEAEGVITDVSWTNPHVRFTMHATTPGAEDRVWSIESNSVSIVSRFGLTADLVAAGTRVKVAGNPGRADADILFLTNMMLPSGEEILFGAGIPARLSQRTIGGDVCSAVAADTENRGIFRVWTNVVPPPAFWGNRFPLTPAAAAAVAKFDPIADDPTANCTPKGMPYIMEQPYPIEFVDAGDEILLELEEYDTVRRIAIPSAAAQPARRGATPATSAKEPGAARLGSSTGRWDGAALVVSTTDIDYPYFNSAGIPLGPDAAIEERFTLNADGSRLDYTMTVTDPATFTAPVTLRKSWEWRPGEQVRPYNCRK
jgi:hypothetical protein